MRTVRSQLLAAALLVVLLAPSSVNASEPPVLKSVLDGFELFVSRRPTYQSLDIAPGGGIKVLGFAIPLGGEGEPPPVVAEQLTLSGIKEQLGRYEISELTFQGVTVALPDAMSVIVPKLILRGVHVRPIPAGGDDAAKARVASLPSREYLVPEILVLRGGESALMENVRWAWNGDPETGSGTSEFEVGRVAVPGTMFKQGNDNPLALLGYGAIELSIKGRWATATAGERQSHDITIEVSGKDMGALSGSFAAEGVPAAFLYRLLLGRASESDLMRDVGQASFKRLAVRYEDKSLATRSLNAIASERGMTVTQVIEEGTAEIRGRIGQMKDPGFTDRSIDTMKSFLANPRSLEFSLSPPTPVPGSVLIDAVNVPSVLLYVLNPKVEANK